jgi:hypothetical protein
LKKELEDEKNNTVKMVIELKEIYKLNAINPYQNFNVILQRNRQVNAKVHLEAQKPQRVKAVLSKKSNAKHIAISGFKLYYGAIITKIAWYRHKKQTLRPVEQN